MKFIDLIKNTKWEDIKSFIRDTDNIKGYEVMFHKLQTITPKQSDMVIHITHIEPNESSDTAYEDVHGTNGSLVKDSEDFEYMNMDKDSPEANAECTYAMDFTAWEEWLDMSIHPDTLQKYSPEQIICECLYEMSFISFDPEEIQSKLDELKERVDKIHNMTPEELKEHSYTLEEVMERLKISKEEREEAANEE
jgi:hypothetical protein